MPQVTINPDGTITATLSAQEQTLAAMILEEKGAGVFSEVFGLWFNNTVKEMFNNRFNRLSQQDRADLMTKMAQAKPVNVDPNSIPVSRP